MLCCVSCNGPEVNEIVEGFGKAKTILSPVFAFEIASRRLAGPASAVLVTVRVLGSERSSSCSSRRRDGGNDLRNRRQLSLGFIRCMSLASRIGPPRNEGPSCNCAPGRVL